MKTKLTILLAALVAASPAFASDFAILGIVAPVPDSGSTLLMLGAALTGIVLFAKRRFQK